jgi:hypothetical protein
MWYHIAAFVAVIVVVIILHYKYAEPRRKFEFRGLSSDDYYKEIIVKPTTSTKPKSKSPAPPKSGKKVWKCEEECRRILEKIYNKSFPSKRPEFLKSPITKQNLELDCYNEELKIALEYDGAQHAKYTPHFHRGDKWKFIYQVRKDDWKTLKCREMNITLIRIPHYVPFDKLEKYIRGKLIKANKL